MSANLDVRLSEKWRKDIQEIDQELERLDAKELNVDLDIHVNDRQWEQFEKDHEEFMSTVVAVTVTGDEWEDLSDRKSDTTTFRTRHTTTRDYNVYGEDRFFKFEERARGLRDKHSTTTLNVDVDDGEVDVLAAKVEALDGSVIDIYAHVHELDGWEDRIDDTFRDRTMRVDIDGDRMAHADGGDFTDRLEKVTYGVDRDKRAAANVKFRDVDRDEAERRLERLTRKFPEANVVGGLRDTGDADRRRREFSTVLEMPDGLWRDFKDRDKFDARFKRATINVQGGRVHFDNEWDRLFEDIADKRRTSRRLDRDSMYPGGVGWDRDRDLDNPFLFRNQGTNELYLRDEFEDRHLTVDWNLSKGDKRMIFTDWRTGEEESQYVRQKDLRDQDRRFMQRQRREAVRRGDLDIRDILKYDLVDAIYGGDAEAELDSRKLRPSIDFDMDRARRGGRLFEVDAGVAWSRSRKQMGAWVQRLKQLIPSMHLWHQVIAALIPVLAAVIIQALGVAVAFGAIAVAGASIIGLGLVGHANNWSDALEEAKTQAKELGKAMFAVSTPARVAFAPIQAQLFDKMPGMSRGMFQDMATMVVYAEDIEDAVRGIFEWFGAFFSLLTQYQPIVSQLADRFGEITGDVLLEGIEWLLEEGYESQDILVAMGSMILDVAAAFYHLFTFAVRVLTVFKPLVEVFEWFVRTVTQGAIGDVLFLLIGGLVMLIGHLYILTRLLRGIIGLAGVTAKIMFVVKDAVAAVSAAIGMASGAMSMLTATFTTFMGVAIPVWVVLLGIAAAILAIWELIGDAPLMPDFGGGMDGPGNDLFGNPNSIFGGGRPSPEAMMASPAAGGGGGGSTTIMNLNYSGDGSHKDREGFADIAQDVSRREYRQLSSSEIPDNYSTNPDK